MGVCPAEDSAADQRAVRPPVPARAGGENYRNIPHQLCQVGGEAGRELATCGPRPVSSVLSPLPLLRQQHSLHSDQGGQAGGQGGQTHQGRGGDHHAVPRPQHRQRPQETGVPL